MWLPSKIAKTFTLGRGLGGPFSGSPCGEDDDGWIVVVVGRYKELKNCGDNRNLEGGGGQPFTTIPKKILPNLHPIYIHIGNDDDHDDDSAFVLWPETIKIDESGIYQGERVDFQGGNPHKLALWFSLRKKLCEFPYKFFSNLIILIGNWSSILDW